MNINNYVTRYQNTKQFAVKRFNLVYSKPLTKKTLNLILSLFLSLFFILFALRPTILIIIKLYKEIQLKQEIVQKMDKQITNLHKAQVSLNETKNLTPMVNNVLPPNADFPRFEREFAYLTLINNLRTTSLNFNHFDLIGKTINVEPKKQISISFNSTLEGSFENIKKFLAELENLDRIVNLNKISMNSQSSKETDILNLTIGGEISYYPPENY